MIQTERLTDESSIRHVMTICREDFFDHSVAVEQRIRELAAKYASHAVFLQAKVDDETAGFISFYANDNVTLTAFLSMIVVRKAFQGKKIGSRFLRDATSILRQRGFSALRLEVRKDNTSAIRFYIRKGFTRECSAGPLSDYYRLQLNDSDDHERQL